ncbi:fad binding domain-containing [Trichoderma arundinaceum]|uniref:Fad binding domain-containing n=1 Tax=Trichoderma arundinaceum TaxID=490622 RepID=A0A395NUG3_TRIAR|nr:fad binding domain-containing [Trichoderma arundinaceum]
MSPKRTLKVLIVGGSISGLSLAVMLEKFGIEFTVLEAYSNIAPDVELLDPTEGTSSHFEQRYGYPVIFIDRQMLLQVLYNKLEHKERVLVNKRVVRIEMSEFSTTVVTRDGETFDADLVVGADGVHSTVRKEMRRIASEVSPGYFSGDEESKVPANYKCIFGISKILKSLPHGQHFTFCKNYSHLIVPGPGDRWYWFLFVKLPQTLYGNNIPRYTKEDERILAEEHSTDKITPGYTFGDLYAARTSSTLVPLQEHVYKRWYFGRIITIGDAVAKQNPIGGQGGNGAIESATALVNSLLRMLDDRTDGLSSFDIDKIFDETQKAHRGRAQVLMEQGKKRQALQALETPIKTIIARFLLPITPLESNFRRLAPLFLEAVKLERLEVPKRPRAHPYSDELPNKPLKTWAPQVVASLCLFLLTLISWKGNGLWVPLNGWFAADISSRTTESKLLNMQQELPPTPVLTNMISPVLAWTVEGYRAGVKNSIISLPGIFIFGILFLGFGNVATMYYLASLSCSYAVPVERPVPVEVAKALVPAVVLSILGFSVLWKCYPATIPLFTWILSATASWPKQVRESISEDKALDRYDRMDISQQ